MTNEKPTIAEARSAIEKKLGTQHDATTEADAPQGPREEYERAVSDAARRGETLEVAKKEGSGYSEEVRRRGEKEIPPGVLLKVFISIRDFINELPLEVRYSMAKRKIEALKNEAHEEGLRLESKYKEVLLSARDALDKLEKFEREELGIKSEDRDVH